MTPSFCQTLVKQLKYMVAISNRRLSLGLRQKYGMPRRVLCVARVYSCAWVVWQCFSILGLDSIEFCALLIRQLVVFL